MIEEVAIVLSSAGGFADVETQRRAACGGCSAQANCGTSLLAKVFGNKRSRIRVLNPVNARAGDRVIIGFDEQMLVKGSLLLYMLPLLSLIFGALAGQLAAQGMDVASPEPAGILGGVAGLVAGLYWVRLKTRSVQNDGSYGAVILRAANQVRVSRPE